MGFGAAGAIARHYELSYLSASLIGLGFGIFLGGLMYLVLGVFYKQQASSLIPTGSAIGCTGRVTTSISENGHGEVGVQVDGQYCTYLASSSDGRSIPKGQSVRIVRTLGSELVVEKE
jgi:membrane protein implicated in regulation of membrane protease activity